MAYASYAVESPRAFLKELRPLLGEVGLLFAWSASKTFTHYGLRVGAIVACVADPQERAATEAALCYSCRGTWSNCSRGGQRAITRLLVESDLAAACNRERDALKTLLGARVAAFNEAASSKKLRYPRYEGGFFVTVFDDDARAHAERMKEKGVFVVPQAGALRVALCSVAVGDIGRLVDTLAS
jgi:aromatic-amino-acid transaminase